MIKPLGRVVAILGVLSVPAIVAAQGTAPSLSKDQRATLLTLVTAVKDNQSDPVAEKDWPVHLFRASDGSHYVAFSAPLPPGVDPARPMALYVRLAPRAAGTAASGPVPRSAVEEWLLGQRSDPLPLSARRVVQVPSGEMPAGGLSATFTRDGSGQNSAALRLMELQRERARAEREAQERKRREEMEGKAESASALLPFEDFDMAARVSVSAEQPSGIRRAVTAGPGEYDLIVSWASLDAKQRPTTTGVIRRTLDLPADPAHSLTLGSIVLAGDIRVRGEPFPADQQTSHPYAIGTMEMEPKHDGRFTNADRLFAGFQVINASPSPTGKPDIAISARLVRKTPGGDQQAATLSPLKYDESNLPVDFDLRAGHPILAAMAAPLRDLPRGEYRLVLTASDRLSRATAVAEAPFRIVATPQVLLAAAPPFRPAFRRDALLEPAVLGPWLEQLAPADPTLALMNLISQARGGRFAQLVPDVSVPAEEAGAALLLQALGLYALGEGSAAVCSRARRAIDRGGRPASAQLLLGACAAMDGQDDDAVAAWKQAVDGGLGPAALALPIAEALARLDRLDEAAAVVAPAHDAARPDTDLVAIRVAADIAGHREAEALERLEPFLASRPIDPQLNWLALHALFAGFTRGEGPGASGPGRAQFAELADAYIAAGGRWQELAGEWAAVVTASSSAP